MEQDPCILLDACHKSYLYTCKDGQNVSTGTCKHRCDIEPGLCGENGVCFYDIADSVIACR
jgi:hypothetical protein